MAPVPDCHPCFWMDRVKERPSHLYHILSPRHISSFLTPIGIAASRSLPGNRKKRCLRMDIRSLGLCSRTCKIIHGENFKKIARERRTICTCSFITPLLSSLPHDHTAGKFFSSKNSPPVLSESQIASETMNHL